MFNELNTYRNTVREGINTKELDFRALKDFIGSSIRVDGFFFTDGKYGKQVVVVGENYNINMPSRCVEVFEEIAKNESKLDAVLKGHLMLKNIKECTTTNGTTTIFEYADC